MVLKPCGIDIHEVCCFVPAYDRSHEPISRSLIRFYLVSKADVEQTTLAGNPASPHVVRLRRGSNVSAADAAVSPCLSFDSLLIFQNNLSSQENVTLPCQLWLPPPPPPPPCHPPSLSHLSFLSLLIGNIVSSLPSLHILSHPLFLFTSCPPIFFSASLPLWAWASTLHWALRNTMFSLNSGY